MAAFLTMELGQVRVGVRADSVDRALAAVEITPLPGAPDATLGVINVHGTVVPVLDLRARLGLPPKPLEPSDHLVLARAARRTVAVVADRCAGLVESATDDLADPAAVLPGICHVAGVAVDADGMVFIHDLDAFLSLEEDEQLGRAVEALG